MRLPLIKRREVLYCVSGAALAGVLFFTVLSMRYTAYIDMKRVSLREVNSRTLAMKAAAGDMNGLVKRFGTRGSEAATGPRGVILASLDEIRQRLRASSMSLSAFDEADGALSIGVEIEAPMGEYGDFVRNIRYLESMSAPWFTMQKVVVAEDVAGYRVRLTGMSMMPLENGSGE